jgi:hypothetical protein
VAESFTRKPQECLSNLKEQSCSTKPSDDPVEEQRMDAAVYSSKPSPVVGVAGVDDVQIERDERYGEESNVCTDCKPGRGVPMI